MVNMSWDMQLSILLYTIAIVLATIMAAYVYKIWSKDKTIHLARTILIMALSWILIAFSVIMSYFARHILGDDCGLVIGINLLIKFIFFGMVVYTYYDLIVRKR